VGKDFLVDSHLVAEESYFLLLRFEKGEALISQDEVERNEPRSNVFRRVYTPKTDILSANGFIQIPRIEMKNSAIPEIFLRAGMLPLHDLSGKSSAPLAGFHLDELEKLLAREIARVRSHNVEEPSFVRRVAEIPERFGMDGEDFHKAKILALIS
jgi:hypothetical protein